MSSSSSQVTTYIQGHDPSTLASHQSRTAAIQASYLLPHITPSSHILDIGCGPGTITCDFASLSPSGHVTGLDYSDSVLSTARLEASNRGLSNITFISGSAHTLPFDDNTFDIVHCHALLVHVPRAVDVIGEMRRVCKAGGYVGVREPDWDTCVIHPFSVELERWKSVQAEMKRREGAEPNAGRHLAEWAVQAGFEVGRVEVSCDVLTYFGKAEREFWGQLYAKRMGTEIGKRAVEEGLATEEEVRSWAEKYKEWAKSETGIWAMMHMRLLCQK